ncbi:MAG: type II secretion system F family protein [Candidatus Falkowbacteria bacterium]
MAIFQYRALDVKNHPLSGLVEAPTEAVAIELLKERSYDVLYIKENTSGKHFNLPFLNRVKPKEVVIFSRQFAVMISANVAMVQSLKIVLEQTENPKFKQVIADIADSVDAGTRLSEAMAKHPDLFSLFYVSVIRAGETSGKLDEVLSYLADEMEKDYDMMSKIKGAMVYPAFVLASMTVVGAVMMIYVVPKLTEIITESGAKLPLATRILIGVSNILQNYWWLIALVGIGVAAGLKTYLKTTKGKNQFDWLIIHLPIFGSLFQKIYLIRFTRSMQTLIVGGVTISESLKITGDVVNNRIYKGLIEETCRQVEDGNSISSVFSESPVIPKMVSQMMTVGEKTGKMETVLTKLTDFYSREVANIVANLMTLLEPIIMIVMGVAVAVMVMAIIMPMYNLSSALGS